MNTAGSMDLYQFDVQGSEGWWDGTMRSGTMVFLLASALACTASLSRVPVHLCKSSFSVLEYASLAADLQYLECFQKN